MTGFLLMASDITKSYAGRVVLPAVDLDLSPGKIVALLGPSGCGKTTLLNILAGFEQPDKGEVRLRNEPCAGPGPDRAVVFQDDALFPWLTALENTDPRGVRQKEAGELLRLVGLHGFEHHLPRELSGGMRQRVALARALALRPDILLMDEPFASLDAITREQMQDLLLELHSRFGMATLLVTHDVREATLLADTVLVMTGNGHLAVRLDLPWPRPRCRIDTQLISTEETIRGQLRSFSLAMRDEQPAT